MPRVPNGIDQSNMEIRQVLDSFLSPEKTVRTQATEWVDSMCASDPSALCQSLMTALQVLDNPPHLRALSAVLIRQTVRRHGNNIPEPTYETLKEGLLASLAAASQVYVARKIADSVAQVAAKIFYAKRDWPQLLQVLSGWCMSPAPPDRTKGYTLLQRVVEHPECAEHLEAHRDSLAALLGKALKDESLEVRMLGLRGACECMQSGSQLTPLLECLRPLAPSLLEVALQIGECEAIDALVSGTESYSKLWGASGPDPQMLQLLATAVLNKEHEPAVRSSAMQLVVAVLKGAGAKWAKRNVGLLKDVTKLVSVLCCEACDADADEWASRREDEVDPQEDISMLGWETCGKLISTIDASTMVPLLIAEAGALVNPAAKGEGAAWQKKYGGLRILAQVASEHVKQLKANLEQIEGVLVLLCKHEQPRVRWAAVEVFNSIIEQMGPNYQRKKHKMLLDTLVRVVREDPSGRCKCKALTGLALFFSDLDEEEDLEWIQPYLEPLIYQALIPVLSNGTIAVQELGLAVAATVARVSGEAFAPFYPTFMQAVKQILQKAGLKELRALCEVAVELAGQLAVAVGHDMFRQDAPAVMECLYSLQTSSASADAGCSFATSVLQAFCHIAECMGEGFLPYLPVLMPGILSAATTEVKINVSENEDYTGGESGSGGKRVQMHEDEASGITKFSIAGPGGALQTICINTVAVEEKQQALEVLGTLCSALGEKFLSFVPAVADILAKELKSDFVTVRSAAFEAVPKLVSVVRSNPPEVLRLLTGVFMPPMLATMDQYMVQQTAMYILPAMRGSLELMAKVRSLSLCGGTPIPWPAGLSDAAVSKFLEDVYAALGRAVKKAVDRQASGGSGEEDEEEEIEDEDEEGDAEDDVIDGAMQCSGAMYKTFGGLCNPSFRTHLALPFYANFLKSAQATEASKVAAVCIFADCIENGGPEAAQAFAPDFIPVLLRLVESSTAERIRKGEPNVDIEEDVLMNQAAAFALGVVAQRNPSAFLPHLGEAVTKLRAALMHPGAREEERRVVADCSCCALLKIIVQFQSELPSLGVDPSPLLSALVGDWFPLNEDEQEAATAHDILMTLIETQSPLLPKTPNMQTQLRRVFEELAQNADCLLSDASRLQNRLQKIVPLI